ncbi:hypothetical protein Tco_0640760 [Tanacetum coccineum]
MSLLAKRGNDLRKCLELVPTMDLRNGLNDNDQDSLNVAAGGNLLKLCSSSRALRMFIEQSHDEVYGCLKGGSGNSGEKRLAISMVEEAWLSEKKEV